MAERYELLDQAVQAILDGATEVAIPRDLEDLVAIAADLRDLPDPEFKRRLGGRMTTATQVQEVIAYLTAEDADGLIDFVKDVFGATETMRTKGGAGGTHCELHIGDTKLYVGGNIPLPKGPNLGTLHVFVRDVDAAYQRALAAGATALGGGLVDQEYGSREGSVRDRWGNEWYIATERGESYRPKNTKDAMPYFHPHGAPRMLAFLENVLGAEVLEKYEHEGAIVHAKVRVGASVVELSEAHGQWQPIPMMFVAAVEDLDDAFERAVAAGAKVLDKPAKQPYGRRGAVEDPFGNQWHFMSEA
ncbi:MAG TPA: VOC family protein [Thermoanaerobaculia bacterium]|nr:VOC family protein [Thermoanaerobaculia bacterium]